MSIKEILSTPSTQTSPVLKPSPEDISSKKQTPNETASKISGLLANSTKKQDKVEELGEYEKIIKNLTNLTPPPASDPSKPSEPFLFNLYRNEKEDKVYMEITKEQLNKEFLMSVTRTTGSGGNYDAQAIIGCVPVYFKKEGKKIYFMSRNVKFIKPKDEKARQVIERNTSDKVIGIAMNTKYENNIVIEDSKTGKILVDASKFFFIKNMYEFCPMPEEKEEISHVLDTERSYFGNPMSFPKNTEIEVALNFRSPNNPNDNFFHRYNYSLAQLPLAQLPKENYQPRLADDRIGYFTNTYQEYGNPEKEKTQIKYIQRWHLEKQNPEAELSPPKEPIKFWLENKIPKQYRDAIAKGVSLWNKAFAGIGFQKAIVVEEQPDDAKWDPSDINYNTVCWTAGTEFNGIGPSFSDPSTGRIYAADIRLNGEDFIRNKSLEIKTFIEPFKSLTKEDKEKYIQDALIRLACHETGHTLGLAHNFKASTFKTPDGRFGSIMDYYPVNLDPNGQYWQTDLGPYDHWAIEYGYKPVSAETPEKEKEILEKQVASKVHLPELIYGTDKDSGMPTVNPDPLCNKHDIGDPLEFCRERISLSKKVWKKMEVGYYEKKVDSYQDLAKIFASGFDSYSKACELIPKYIGGIYHNYSHPGDKGFTKPIEPVPPEKQREALQFLVKEFFSPNSFYFSPDLLNKLKDEYSDVLIYSPVLRVQSQPLKNLYHPYTLTSILNNQHRYKDKYFTMQELFSTLRQAIWSELEKGESIGSFRRNLQKAHLEELIRLVTEQKEGMPKDAISLARADLKAMKNQIEKVLSQGKLDPTTSAHLEDVKAQIEAAKIQFVTHPLFKKIEEALKNK